MLHDNFDAAARQARHEGPAVETGVFTADNHIRSIAACAGTLVALGIGLDRTSLDDVLAEAIHAHNTTHPDEHHREAVDAEWKEAYRVAGLLIHDYTAMPQAAATWLMGMKAGDLMGPVS